MTTTVTSLSTPFARVAGPPGQPDIAYAPDLQKYQARTARRLAGGDLPKTLPEGFPSELQGDLVWEGETLAETYDWTYVLSDDQLDEIEGALRYFKGAHASPSGSLSCIYLCRSAPRLILTLEIPQDLAFPLATYPPRPSPCRSSTPSSVASHMSYTSVTVSS